MIYRAKNLSRDPLTFASDGDEFFDCNISQAKARTKIAVGVKGLTFTGCNLFNCILPDSARYTDCLYNDGEHPDNPLQQDIIEPTPEEVALEAKRMEAAATALEIFRTEIKTEIAKETNIDPGTVNKIVGIVANKLKPVKGIEP